MLEVIEPGLLSSMQDFGRPDAIHLGVPEGGACDHWSLGVANALAGNAQHAPALEITLVGPRLRVLRDCFVGLAGADLGASIEMPGTAAGAFPPGRALWLRAGQSLVFGSAGERQGIRGYLALAGGIDAERVLGSASTCLVGGFGGIEGRTLVAGDVLRAPEAAGVALPERRWPARFEPALEATRRALRVVRGPHLGRLPRAAFERLLSTEFRVSARGDRQGIVLDGPALPSVAPGDTPMLSQGVTWGALQLPADGRPILLLADHQTVGGYPVLAVVISADLPLLGQLGPGDPVSFREVSFEHAESALRGRTGEWQAGLRALRPA